MHFHIGKFGGGCLRGAKDVIRLFEVLQILGINIVVVSAFNGITNLLDRIVKEKSLWLFIHEFLSFHQGVAKELGLEDNLKEYFALQTQKFEILFSRLCETELDFENGHFLEIYAEIIAIGEDFSSRIVFEYVANAMEGRVRVLQIDSRTVVAVNQFTLIDAEPNQNLSRTLIINELEKINMPFIVVIQGFVAGARSANTVKTALLVREGSDITAALFAASLSFVGRTANLTYVKSFFEKNSKNDVLIGNVGIVRLARYIQSTGVNVVSLKILKIKNLPGYFQIVDFGNLGINVIVALEPLVLNSLIKRLTTDRVI